MPIEPSAKIHVAERRAFETDVRRHFVGEIVEARDAYVVARGFTFVYDTATAEFVKRPEVRTRVIPLVDARLCINVIPESVDLAEVTYASIGGKAIVTDGDAWSLDVQEFGINR